MERAKLLIRADASPTIGTGHVMRCLALAETWNRTGGQSCFVTGDIPAFLRKKIDGVGSQVFSIANTNADALDARDTTEIANVFAPDWILTDGYRFTDAYHTQLKKLNCRMMAIDDFGHAKHRHADLILNQNAYAKAEQYSAAGPNADLMIGPQYALLRKEFGTIEDQRHGEQRKRIPKMAKRILVTFGGADPDNWTARTLEALIHIGNSSKQDMKQFSVDAIVGPCFQDLESLRLIKKKAPFTLRVHRNVDRMSTLINSVDMAITAGGTTCYELARCGVPAVIVAIADNQLAVAKKFGEMQLALDMGDHRQVDDLEFAKTIAKMIRKQDLRRDMSIRGQQLVDGQGSRRIVRRMIAGLFSFRVASKQDSELLYNWRNDPEVRAVSFDENPVSWNTHLSWIAGTIKSKDREIWIAENRDGNPVGQIRFDINRMNNCAMISVSLAFTFRGRGIGTALIERASREFLRSATVDKVVAQVKPANTPSQLSFRRAGFRPIAPTTVSGKVAHQFVLTRRDLEEANFSDMSDTTGNEQQINRAFRKSA